MWTMHFDMSEEDVNADIQQIVKEMNDEKIHAYVNVYVLEIAGVRF